MTNRTRIAAPLFYALISSQAHADFYSCKDNTGHLITSDRPIPECADKATQVFKNNGMLKTEMHGALTPEQRHAAELQEQQRALATRQAESDKKEQRYLLAHYPSEHDVEVERKKALDIVELKITVEKKNIAATTELFNKNHNELVQLAKNQASKINEMKNKEDDLKLTIAQSDKLIQRYQAEAVSINREFDDTHKRYIELISSRKN
jgi:hypothetical protein